MTINEKIDLEKNRLIDLFQDLNEESTSLAMGLIENASFMRVTLDELQASITKEGATDDYKNGANQFGKKASAQLQAYNSLLKNYTSVIKTLDSMRPIPKPKPLSHSFKLRELTPEEERQKELEEQESERKKQEKLQKEIDEAMKRVEQIRSHSKANEGGYLQ